jgi:hypothetical protein
MKIKVDFKGEEVYENNTCLDVWMCTHECTGRVVHQKAGKKVINFVHTTHVNM